MGQDWGDPQVPPQWQQRPQEPQWQGQYGQQEQPQWQDGPYGQGRSSLPGVRRRRCARTGSSSTPSRTRGLRAGLSAAAVLRLLARAAAAFRALASAAVRGAVSAGLSAAVVLAASASAPGTAPPRGRLGNVGYRRCRAARRLRRGDGRPAAPRGSREAADVQAAVRRLEDWARCTRRPSRRKPTPGHSVQPAIEGHQDDAQRPQDAGLRRHRAPGLPDPGMRRPQGLLGAVPDRPESAGDNADSASGLPGLLLAEAPLKNVKTLQSKMDAELAKTVGLKS